ncbi:MAG: SprT-like domain-containing protein [Bacteroidetes bacterium]|nr:SprT-like domain-containing protein [Bacteroidota bacterium]
MPDSLKTLEKYLPDDTANNVLHMLLTGGVKFVISRERKTRLGVYRPATRNLPHRISVNHNLNKYEFLFTFLHEYAHYQTYIRYGRRHKPHGPEWRAAFRELVMPFLTRKVFPPDLEQGIMEHFSKPGITDCSDRQLRELFGRYDPDCGKPVKSLYPTVDMLPLNSRFALPDGRQFIKLKLRRTRYTCLCCDDNRLYIFGPKVQVILVSEPEHAANR